MPCKNKVNNVASVTNQPTCRPGRQGLFHGEKLKWLDRFENNFKDVVRAGDTGALYSCVTRMFFDRYGYDLPISQNPPLGVDLATLKPIPICDFALEQQENEVKRRKECFEGLCEKFSNWFRYQFKSPAQKMLVSKLGDALIVSMRIRPLKKKSLREAYYDLFWKTEVKEKFDAFWAENTRTRSLEMTERNKFLDRALEAEPRSVHDQLSAYIEGDHQITLDEWNKRKDSLKPDEDESSDVTWEIAKEFLPALADALSEWLGACVLITTVSRHEGEVDVHAVQSATVNSEVKALVPEYHPKDWGVFRNMMGKYGEAYFGLETKKAHQSVIAEDCAMINKDVKSAPPPPSANDPSLSSQQAPLSPVGETLLPPASTPPSSQMPFQSGDLGVPHHAGTWKGDSFQQNWQLPHVDSTLFEGNRDTPFNIDYKFPMRSDFYLHPSAYPPGHGHPSITQQFSPSLLSTLHLSKDQSVGNANLSANISPSFKSSPHDVLPPGVLPSV